MQMLQCLDIELSSSLTEINYSYQGFKSKNTTNGTLDGCLLTNSSKEYLITGMNNDILFHKNVKFTYKATYIFENYFAAFVGPNIYQLMPLQITPEEDLLIYLKSGDML